MKGVLLVVASLVLVGFSVPQSGQLRLIQPSDFQYQGAFRVPRAPTDPESFDFGGTALAYYAAHDSLFLVGHDHYQRVAEITIPRPAGSATPDGLPEAAIRQPLVDVLEGRRVQIGEQNVKIGGLLVWGDALIATAYVFYDSDGRQVLSHFRSTLDLARANDVQGPFKVGNAGAGFVSGYMTEIPREWQRALGGVALTGQCCLSIISRTSLGPAVSVFSPSDIGGASPVAATPVLGYPMAHPTLGECDGHNRYFNCTTAVTGVIFPPGSRSVLFFGRHGLGPFCYGEVTMTGEPGKCVDPASEPKGGHAYPYAYQIWAYDVLDLIAVKNGAKQRWDVKPYATWTFELPFAHPNRGLMGATYDPATRRVFISVAHGDAERPLIHVYTLTP